MKPCELASQQTGTGRKDAENEHQGQNQLEKVFPSQAIKTVFTGACRAQQSAVDQLVCQYHVLFAAYVCIYLPIIQSLARILETQLASYQLTQYAQVKVRQLGSQIKLVCQLARQHTTPQQSFTTQLGTQVASSQVLGTQSPAWLPLASQLPT